MTRKKNSLTKDIPSRLRCHFDNIINWNISCSNFISFFLASTVHQNVYEEMEKNDTIDRHWHQKKGATKASQWLFFCRTIRDIAESFHMGLSFSRDLFTCPQGEEATESHINNDSLRTSSKLLNLFCCPHILLIIDSSETSFMRVLLPDGPFSFAFFVDIRKLSNFFHFMNLTCCWAITRTFPSSGKAPRRLYFYNMPACIVLTSNF